MSSILKALRKLEEEKAATGEVKVDLARDILRRSPAPKASTGPAPVVVSVAVLLVVLCCGILVWWFLLPETPRTGVVTVSGGATGPVTGSPPLSSAQPPSPPVSPKAPSVPPEQPVQVALSAVETPVSGADLEGDQIDMNAHISTGFGTEGDNVLDVSTAPVSAVKQEVTTVDAPLALDGVTPVEPQARLQAQVVPAPICMSPPGAPVLQVSAIAYALDPGSRLAVINDLPVMVGNSIEGVLVMGIEKSLVQFSWQDHSFCQAISDQP